MTELQIFKNPDFGEIRTIEKDGEPWFVGKDVAAALGYADYFGALKKHVEEEDKQNCQNDSFESPRGMTIINESGLYSLVLSGKLPTAKKFKRWVTSEVIPSIRKHGAYMTPETLEAAILNPDTMIRLCTALKDEQDKRKALEVKMEEQKPKVLFAESVEAAKTSILIGELAKLLKQNGINIGQNRLFEWMRQNGYLIRRQGSDYNMPTQKSMELGLFEIKESCITHSDGHIHVSKTTKVTGKGQVYFVNLFLKGEEKRC